MNKILISLIVVCYLFTGFVTSLDKNKHCKCRIQTSKRIVGGNYSNPTDYPWQVSIAQLLNVKNDFFKKLIPDSVKIGIHGCGGVLLNEKYVLTAAHCTLFPIIPLYVGAGGKNDLVEIFNNGRAKVKRKIRHPDYSMFGRSKDDIAILELESPIEFNDEILPACLDTVPDKADYGSSLILTGFGSEVKVIINATTNEEIQSGKASRHLKEVLYKDISSSVERCQNDPGKLCVDSVNGENESGCVGDSGGPMHFISNGKATIIGLTSGSDSPKLENDLIIHCNGKAHFSRVGYYLKWIESIVGDDHC